MKLPFLTNTIVYNGEVTDSDAAAFIAAAGITNQTQQTAINSLVLNLKAASLWTKMTAIYPFVGGTASSHSYNLKNTAQYQITWNGTVTHNSNGITGNGSTGYGNLGLAPSQFGTQNSQHISLYNRSNITGTNGFDFSACNAGQTQETTLIVSFVDNNLYFRVNTNNYKNISNSSSIPAFYTITRTGSTTSNAYKNGTSFTSSTDASTTPYNQPMYILASNYQNTGAKQFSNKNFAFASCGEGLNATEVSNFYTAVQAYQTALGRQV